MDLFEQHEIFEIEVLENLKNARLLDPLVFGGGSMLRLCHELKRYSVDLDFWMLKKLSIEEFFYRFKNFLEEKYNLTDAQIKYFTLLFEIRSPRYPRRLKIEIRKEIQDWDFQEKIAYSKFSARQVLLKAFTLEQTMKNKIVALIDRNEIRDAFDIEFMLRQGISLPELTKNQISSLIKKIDDFKPRDFRVKLGSILEPEMREYYINNRFHLLKQKLQNLQRHLQ